mmetsp:Transcript_8189/g.8044  ORF Transcript_8189/g.8044 Transcript_8189/m.8044 type:complete len:370 (+) Transcript_8189:279-1388(+)
MLIYLISETKGEDGHSFKKFGKICFVDLAGSERLKETKSQGIMVKETGNINRSLFTLGKVISALGDKKNKSKSHIPYRDSKLTMLLMDSLGGTSKALMIACVSPASAYAEETASTLNYAGRAMNIKNKPVIQMDSKEQIIFSIKREIQLLRMENEYLKEQLYRVTGGMPPLMVDFARNRSPSAKSANSKLPPIPNPPHMQSSAAIIDEYQKEMNRIKEENIQLNNGKEVLEKLAKSVVAENQVLAGKLNNLEHVFTGYTNPNDQGAERTSNQYTITNLLNDNANIKRQISKMEYEKAEMRNKLNDSGNPTPRSAQSFTEMNDAFQLKQMNTQLQKRIEFLQKREKDLLEHLLKAQKENGQNGQQAPMKK